MAKDVIVLGEVAAKGATMIELRCARRKAAAYLLRVLTGGPWQGLLRSKRGEKAPLETPEPLNSDHSCKQQPHAPARQTRKRRS